MTAKLDTSITKDVSFDGTVELRLKITQNKCPAMNLHSTIVCGPPHKTCVHR